MATILKKGNKLYIDYRVNGIRKRKSTGLDDTQANRNLLSKKVIPEIMAKVKLGLEDNDLPKPKNTFKYYGDFFLQLKEKNRSYASKECIYLKVIEFFKNYNVKEITRLDVKRYLESMDIKSRSKREYLSCIKGILDLALDDREITDNVATGIKLPKDTPLEVKPFSKSEVKLLIDSSYGIFRYYLIMAFNTGMRPEEILGLQVNDISDKYIDIKRVATKNKISYPKTIGSIRKIPVSNTVLEVIDELKSDAKSLYLFGTIRDISYFRRQWRTVIKRSGVEYRKLYNTRHTYITQMLISSRYKVMDIAKLVGHTSPRMILSTYSGFIESEHLKVDVDFDIYEDGHSLGTPAKTLELKKA